MHRTSVFGRTPTRRTVLLIGTGLAAVTAAVGVASAVVTAGRPAAAKPASVSQSQSLRASFVQRLEELNQDARYGPASDSRFETLRVSSNGGEWQKAVYSNAAGESC